MFDKPAAIRVLVVDDHEIVRRSICTILSQDSTLEVICESADGESAVQKAQELQPDVILLDINLLGISGFEAASLIRQVAPQSEIIFLSQYDSLSVVTEAMKIGGRGYVTKNRAASDLLKAIREVRGGTQFVSKDIADQGWVPQA